MNDIIKQYGRVLITICVIMGIFGILFFAPMSINGTNASFFEQLRISATTPAKTTASIDGQNYENVKKRALPKVTGNNHLLINTAYTTNELITAKDANNNTISNPIILEIYTKDGQQDISSTIYNASTKKYTFTTTDIYRLKIYVADSQGSKTTCFVQINLMDH